MPTIEELQAELSGSATEFRSITTEIKKTLETQGAEIKQHGSSGTETVKKLGELEKKYDDHGTRMQQIQTELMAEITKQVETAKALTDRLDEIEKTAGRPGNPFAGQEASKTLGEQLIDMIGQNRAAFESFGAGSSRGNSLPMLSFKTFEGQPGFVHGPAALRGAQETLKALTSGMTPNFIAPLQLPGYIPLTRRRLRMRDLIPNVQTTAATIRYLRQTGFTSINASSVTGITRSGTVATVTQAAHGYQNFDLIKISGAAQAAYNGNWRITVVDANTYTFSGVQGAPTTPATGTVTAKRMNNFGAATFVSENSLKPQGDFFYDERTAVMQVLAHFIKSTRQVLDDMPGLRANVDSDLTYGLLYREDGALLYGTGSSPQVPGIMLDPDIQTYLWSQGKTGDNKADAIRRARTLVELANFEATGAVIHPTVWEEIETIKGSDGHYLWVSTSFPQANPGGENLWRLPLVITPTIAAGDFLVGAFGPAATLYDREQANIRFADQNEDDFTNNRVTILAEERLGVAWKRPEAFVKGTFDSQPA